MMRRRIALPALGLVMVLLTGCAVEPYVIHGRAVRSDFTTASFVDVDDSRLLGEGLSSVDVYLIRNPTRGDREVVARVQTNDVGEFAMPVNAYGAGWMIEEWMIHTYRPGFQSVESIMTLPKPKETRALLLMLGRGIAEQPALGDDHLRQYEHFK